jgi:RNA polymerase sigma-70 factor, ECF subfamily
VADPDPDAELMRRVKRGDREAFGMLVDKYKQPILNLMFRMIGDLAEAEDLAQSVFIQAYRAAPRYREDARFSTWLYTIARHLCLNEIRRRSRHPAESLDAAAPDSGESRSASMPDPRMSMPPEAVLEDELEQKIQAGLADLPANQRLAILLCRDEELSYDDIARVLGCSVSATKSVIHRGRETLKLRLKAYLRTGEWQEQPPRSSW